MTRPREHLLALGKRYPDAWKWIDAFRADKGKDLSDWPDWCYCPVAGAYAVVSGGGYLPPALGLDVGRVAALSAWRVTQGIYRFDDTLYHELIRTPVTGDLPGDVLHCLPEWCVYIETPGLELAGDPIAGAFVHLEQDANDGREELRLVLDIGEQDAMELIPIPIHLGGGLQSGIEAASVEAQRQAWRHKVPKMADAIRDLPPLPIEPIVSLVLYLCSQAAEIGDGTHAPAHPQPKKTKKGWRIFPPDKAMTWDVGVRLGAALRRGMENVGDGSGTHAGPRPHVRRAHWHTYWTGPKKKGQKPTLKWLPPIPVNVDDNE